MWKVLFSATILLLLSSIALGAEIDGNNRKLLSCPAREGETCLCNFEGEEVKTKRCTEKEETIWDSGTTNPADDVTGKLFYTIDYDLGTGNADASYCVNIASGSPFDEYCLNLNGCAAATIALTRDLCTCEVVVDDTPCTSCSFCDGNDSFTYDCENVVAGMKTDACKALDDYSDLVGTLGEGGSNGSGGALVSVSAIASAVVILLSFTL